MPGVSRGVAVAKDVRTKDHDTVVLSYSQAVSMYLIPNPHCQNAGGLTELCERVMKKACMKRLHEMGVMANASNATGMADYADSYDTMFQHHCNNELIDHPEIDISNVIHRYIFPILLFMGTVGNLTSIRYLHNLSINVWSTCLYLTVLSVVDLLILYVDCGNKWYIAITDINLSEKISTTSGAICKVYPFIFQFFVHLNPWIIVACSVELSIASRFPHLTYKMCTRERAKAVMLLMTVLLVCINMHYFWTYGLIRYVDGNHFSAFCIYIEEFTEYFRDTIWPFMSLAVGHIAPLLVVTICFFISLISFFRTDPIPDIKLEKYFMDLKSLQQLKVTFVVICLFYVIVTTMKILLVIVEYLMGQGVITIPCSIESHVFAVMHLLKSIWHMMFYLFLSVKFFVYLGTCARFRADIYKLLSGFCHRFRRKDGVTLTPNDRLDSKPLVNHRNNIRQGHKNNICDRSAREGFGVTTAV